jgi:hypothetical protein
MAVLLDQAWVKVQAKTFTKWYVQARRQPFGWPLTMRMVQAQQQAEHAASAHQ